jgi:phospholipase A1
VNGRAALLAGVLLSGAAPGLAQLERGAFASCAEIAAEAERLACYDKAALPRQDPPANPQEGSLLGEAWALDADSARIDLSLYQPNYILPVRYTNKVNVAPYSGGGTPSPSGQTIDDIEAKFQVSFKARVGSAFDRRLGVWLGYTQQSQWQVYNTEGSAPFRETNYMPEAILMVDPRTEVFGVRWRLVGVSFTHQSNGRAEPLSRSWNRVIGQFGFERGAFAMMLRPWARIKEDPTKDDNPDITTYLGHGDLTLLYKWQEHSFNLMLRGGKGAMQASWTGPRWLGPLKGYVQVFSGYGESLIDYNWSQTTVGVGVALNDLF